MSETAELTELPPAETALQVYQQPNGLDPYIERIRQEVTGHPVDLSTKKGRDAVASRAFKVRKIKAALDSLGKEQVDRLKEIPKLIDAERKRMRETLDALADEVRQPLTQWEESEEARIAHHKAGVEWFRLRAEENRDLDVGELRASIEEVAARVVDESWEEFEAEAHRMKARALDGLTQALAARERHEAEQAELARLRAEAEQRRIKDEQERIAREAAERATREAEAKAQVDRDAAAKREADAKAAAERSEREKQEAIERQRQAEARAEAEKLAAEQRVKDAAEAARKAELARQQRERDEAEAAQRKREADKQHKAGINNAALAAFIENGLPEECARQAVVMIAKGLIPSIKITY